MRTQELKKGINGTEISKTGKKDNERYEKVVRGIDGSTAKWINKYVTKKPKAVAQSIELAHHMALTRHEKHDIEFTSTPGH